MESSPRGEVSNFPVQVRSDHREVVGLQGQQTRLCQVNKRHISGWVSWVSCVYFHFALANRCFLASLSSRRMCETSPQRGRTWCFISFSPWRWCSTDTIADSCLLQTDKMKAVFFFGRDSEAIHVSNYLHQPASSSSSSSSFSSSSAEMPHLNWSSWCVKALVGFGGASACSGRQQCLNFTSAVSQAAPPGGVQQRPTGAMVGSSNWISH